MRRLLNSHLFQLGDVDCLFTAHLFQISDVICLFLPHFFESSNVLVRPPGLGLKHGYVGLETLVDFALSLDLRLNGPQVL